MVHGALVFVGCVLYGFSVVNVPIGLVGYLYYRYKQRKATNQNTRRDAMDKADGFLLSAIPIVGPVLALAGHILVYGSAH